jgi:hypothetical protein
MPLAQNVLLIKGALTVKKLNLVLASVALCCSSAAYAANVNVFDNASNYNAAVGGELFRIDFNGSPDAIVDGSTISPHAIFGSPEASNPASVLWSSNALTDAGSTIASNSVGPLSIDFSDPAIFNFSLTFSSAGIQETIELYDDANTLFANIVSPGPNGFFGLTSDVAIDYVIIRNGIFPGGGNDRFFIDNLSADAVVPVPAAIWLLGSGLIGLVSVARRKKA